MIKSVQSKKFSIYFNVDLPESHEEEEASGNQENLELASITAETSSDIPNQNIKMEKIEKENFVKLTINNCENPQNALDLLISDSQLSEINKTIIISVVMDTNFEHPDATKIQNLAKIFKTQSVLTILFTKSFDKFQIFWKSKEIENFLTLKSPKKHPSVQKQLFGFIADFFIHCLPNGHLGLRKGFEIKDASNEIEINQLADCDGFDLLQLAAELGEIETVKVLLEIELFDDLPNNNLNAQSLAQNGCHFDILLILLKENFSFPIPLNIDKCPIELVEIFKLNEELHKLIKTKSIEKVDEIISQNRNQKYFYNSKNESAIKVSLESKQFEIYDYLLANNISLGPHENFIDIFSILSESERTILREIHFKYSKDLPEKHMSILMMNTQISHDESNKDDKEELVLRAYRALNKNPHLSIILKTVAASKRFEIIFDFKRDSVHVIDPTADSNSKGVFYLKGKICIGAKELLDPTTEHETFGTLAHELCHYAMQLTFNNFAKPYAAVDRQTKERFKIIRQICFENRSRNKIVGLSFDNYESYMHCAELIVRVPHLIALMHQNPDELKKCQEFFPELFNFYLSFIIPSMVEALPKIKEKADTEIEKKDKKITKLKIRIFIILISSCVISAFIGFYFFNPSYTFDSLNDAKQDRIKNSIVNYKGTKIKLIDLFSQNSSALSALTSDHITDMLNEKNLDLNDSKLHYLNKLITFEWENISEILRKIILNSDLNFQGVKIKFRDLFNEYSETFYFLNSDQLIKIISGHVQEVGKALEIKSKFYIKRCFLPYDAKDFKSQFKEAHNVSQYQHDLISTIQNFSYFFLNQSYKRHSKKYDLNEHHFRRLVLVDPYMDDLQFIRKNSTEIIEQVKTQKVFLLSSDAGMGKTATFENFALEIKKLYPTWWVSFITLKEYTQFFKSSISVDNILKQILNLNSSDEFEMEIFNKIFNSKKVVLIWDGFDEICPTHNESVSKIFSYVLNTINIQFISTRPIYMKNLRHLLKVRPWELVPFDNQSKIEFLKNTLLTEENSWIGSNSKLESDKLLSEKLIQIKNIIEKLEKIQNYAERYDTPLMLQILYEISHEVTSPNLYEIYQLFMKKKLTIWKKKSELDIIQLFEIDKLKILDIFKKYGILENIHEIRISTLCIKIRKLRIMQKDVALPFEEISRMGILNLKSDIDFHFGHKSFSIFFVAQYFIENLYNAVDYYREEEFEIRIELFFAFLRSYEYGSKLTFDFMSFFIKIDNAKTKFCPTLNRLFRTKFRRLFIDLLDINNPNVFEFLFEFFSKDHNLLVNLLHVYETETLYTAVFNPNYFALFTNPDEIKELGKNKLTKNEFENFMEGKNQKGKILYGIHFYRLIGVNKPHDSLNILLRSLNITDFWGIFDKTDSILTENEKIELFMSVMSPKIFIFYEWNMFLLEDFEKYQNFWTKYENLLSSDEMENSIGNSMLDFLEINPVVRPNSGIYLWILIHKSEIFLTKSQIFNMFMSKNLLNNAVIDHFASYYLLEFFKNNTNEIQMAEMLRQNSKNLNNFYFFGINNDPKMKHSTFKLYPYRYYDYNPFTLLHRSIMFYDEIIFSRIILAYLVYLPEKNLRSILIDSSDVLLYTLQNAPKSSCQKFVRDLEIIFKNHTYLLRELFTKKIRLTNLSLFDYVKSYKGLSIFQYEELEWYDKLKYFEDLYDRIK